jgi:lipoyl(octanoyl) transferase
MNNKNLQIRWLGRQDYLACWQAMQTFTHQRHHHTLDEIWLCEHYPVYTQGQNGKPEHVLNPGQIPVVQTDRGGQITYHGPGQLMIYTLIDIKRLSMNVRRFVSALEQSIIDLLYQYQINAHAKREAPGVYIEDKKICSIGLRIRKGCSYHGIAFNIAMDVTPFNGINPCGFTQLQMTQFSELGGLTDLLETGKQLVHYLMKNLMYTHSNFIVEDTDGIKSSTIL